MTQYYRQLKPKQCNRFTDISWSTQLVTQREPCLSYFQFCCIPTTVTYPLTSSFLILLSMKSVQRKPWPSSPRRMDSTFMHTTTNAIRSPQDFGSADFWLLPAVQQVIAQAMYFLRHWLCQSSVGKWLLWCTLACWHLLSVGMPHSILGRVAVSAKEWKKWRSLALMEKSALTPLHPIRSLATSSSKPQIWLPCK